MKNFFLKDHFSQTIAEEIANAITHALGIGFSIIALVFMVLSAIAHGGAKSVVSCAVFGASLILLYLSSTFYHAVWHQKTKFILQKIDHMMIYILIAGTYTPFTLIALQGGWGWSLFGTIWGLALAGMVFKLFFTGRYEKLSVSIYILMGWCAIVALKPILQAIPLHGFYWILGGGLAYTFGVIFYAFDRIRFAHTLWHLFVLTGSICHVIAILYYVLPISQEEQQFPLEITPLVPQGFQRHKKFLVRRLYLKQARNQAFLAKIQREELQEETSI